MAVRELGEWIGQGGNTLIYGGSRTGPMGEIAESVLMAGVGDWCGTTVLLRQNFNMMR